MARVISSDSRVKLALLGAGSVGKSALCVQWVKSQYIEDYDPTVEDAYTRQTLVDDKTVVVDILDTAGQEEFVSLRAQHILTTNAFMIVYDMTSVESFKEAKMLLEEIKEAKDGASFCLVVVGNKADLEEERQVVHKQGQQLANNFGCKFLETSAKTGANVDAAFLALLRAVIGKESLNQKLLANRLLTTFETSILSGGKIRSLHHKKAK